MRLATHNNPIVFNKLEEYPCLESAFQSIYPLSPLPAF